MDDEFEKQDTKGLRKKDFKYFISELIRLAKLVENVASRKSGYQGTKSAGGCSDDEKKDSNKKGNGKNNHHNKSKSGKNGHNAN